MPLHLAVMSGNVQAAEAAAGCLDVWSVVRYTLSHFGVVLVIFMKVGFTILMK